jgi:hypothetical protein
VVSLAQDTQDDGAAAAPAAEVAAVAAVPSPQPPSPPAAPAHVSDEEPPLQPQVVRLLPRARTKARQRALKRKTEGLISGEVASALQADGIEGQPEPTPQSAQIGPMEVPAAVAVPDLRQAAVAVHERVQQADDEMWLPAAEALQGLQAPNGHFQSLRPTLVNAERAAALGARAAVDHEGLVAAAEFDIHVTPQAQVVTPAATLSDKGKEEGWFESETTPMEMGESAKAEPFQPPNAVANNEHMDTTAAMSQLVEESAAPAAVPGAEEDSAAPDALRCSFAAPKSAGPPPSSAAASEVGRSMIGRDASGGDEVSQSGGAGIAVSGPALSLPAAATAAAKKPAKVC